MQAELGLPASPRVLAGALTGLVKANKIMMRAAQTRGQRVPRLYKSGVRYRRERPGYEKWDTWDRVLRRGYGDCEDLAAWRVAELHLSGQDPGARAIVKRTGRRTLHALVRRGDGTLEDPSQRLGMRRGGLDDRPEVELGAAPNAMATYRIQRVPGGWIARVQLPGRPAGFLRSLDRPNNQIRATPAARKKAKRKAKKSSKKKIVRVVGKVLSKAGNIVGGPLVGNLIKGLFS